MKAKIALFVLLFFLLSACGMPVATEPVVHDLSTPTFITTINPTSSSQSGLPSKTPFCQGEPEYIEIGSATTIKVFALPPNQLIATYLDSQLIGTDTTNLDGYASISIAIPMDQTIGLHLVSIYTVESPPIIITCQIVFWSDSIPSPTYIQPSLTPKPTLSPIQLTMIATQQTLQEKMRKYCGGGSAWDTRLSPNDQWAEVICRFDTIKIVNIGETKIWDMSSKGLIDPFTDHFVNVSHWSNDGAYVYVVVDPHTDGYWEFFHQGFALYRLTLETGQISEVLPLVKSNWRFYSFAFSPNDRRLAYIVTDKSPVVLNIRDMQTGDEQSFEFDSKYNTGGGFLWAPDSQKLVFSITQFDTSAYEDVATSVILWDKEKPNTTTLIKDQKEILVPVEWIDETRIVLQVLYKDETKFEFDLVSGELNQINP